MKYAALLTTALSLAILAAGAQQKPSQKTESDHHEMEMRGDHVMGFSHEKTTHHFLLYKNGGAIEVAANNANDEESRNQIRMHLSHIAQMFADGNFNAPMLIHDTNPPGASTMAELRQEIEYKYAATKNGGSIRIRSGNQKAIAAIHDFLRFQIEEHKTGDTVELTQP